MSRSADVVRPVETRSIYSPGDIVVLKHGAGCKVQQGSTAVIVPPEEFPSYMVTMLETVGEKDLYEHFIALRWIPSALNLDVGEDGFYAKFRFEKKHDVAKG